MKYIIEIEDEPFESPGSEHRLWKSTEFNSLVFDKTGLEKLTLYDESAVEQRGQEEAWELAKIVCCDECDGGMDMDDIASVFTVGNPVTVFRKYSYTEARDKYEAWKKQKDKIRVGDEVAFENGSRFVVYDIFNSGELCGCGYERHSGRRASWSCVDPEAVRKTGRHFSGVEEVLEKMKEPKC